MPAATPVAACTHPTVCRKLLESAGLRHGQHTPPLGAHPALTAHATLLRDARKPGLTCVYPPPLHSAIRCSPTRGLLVHGHHEGFIHRDIKPTNVLS